MRIYCICSITALTYIPNVAMALSDEDWLAYFGNAVEETRDYYVKMQTPVRPRDFIRREKPKGTEVIDGKEYRASTVVFDSGPYANQVIQLFSRASEDGLYERRREGEEKILVPRPVEKGQTWIRDSTTYTFEGVENFETFDRTIEDCAKITAVGADADEESETTTKYYEKGKGLVYKSVTKGNFGIVIIWREYAAKDD